MGRAVREVGLLYAAFLAGRPQPLPELAVPVCGLRRLATAVFWRATGWERDSPGGGVSSRGLPAALELPADHPRPAVLSVRGGAHSFAIGGETLAGLARLSRRHGATLFMTLLAGLRRSCSVWRGKGAATSWR